MSGSTAGHVPHLARHRRGGRVGGLHDSRCVRGHGRPRCGPPDSVAARSRPRSPLELQGGQVRLLFSAEINGMPRLMCMTRLEKMDLTKPVTIEPMRAFPCVRDLVVDVSQNFRMKKSITPFTPRKPDAPDGTWRMKQEDVERVQEFRKCVECFLCQDVCHVLRDHHKHDEFIGPRLLVSDIAALRNASPGRGRIRLEATSRIARTASATATSPSAVPSRLPGAHHDHRQRDHPPQGTSRG